MTYADYLSQWSYNHMLGRNQYLGMYKRLPEGLPAEEYSNQIDRLKSVVSRGATYIKNLE